jgi:hypothetical protein
LKFIQLTQGKSAKVDDQDFDWLNQWKWCVGRQPRKTLGYVYIACRHDKNGLMILMHRAIAVRAGLLTGFDDPHDIDHWNTDNLDNQRANLRSATRTQNLGNSRKRNGCTSQFKGVSFDKKAAKPWRMRLKIGNVLVSYKCFATEHEAHEAYVAASRAYYGQFSRS